MRSDFYGSILIGVMVLIPTFIALERCESEPEPAKVNFLHQWNESLCRQVKLSSPGGLSFELAEVCYIPNTGWHETKNTARLQTDQYESLIKPLYKEIRSEARSLQLYDEYHNDFMYRMFIATRNTDAE